MRCGSRFELDKICQDLNKTSKEIGKIKKKLDATELIQSMEEIKGRLATKKTEVHEAKTTLDAKLVTIGNIVHESVPVSKGEDICIWPPFIEHLSSEEKLRSWLPPGPTTKMTRRSCSRTPRPRHSCFRRDHDHLFRERSVATSRHHEDSSTHHLAPVWNLFCSQERFRQIV